MSGHERISVLVADYAQWTRHNLSTMLDAAGFGVAQASNGVTALRIAQNIQPEIVLLGHHLPEIGTSDLLATLKGDPRTRRCAVVQLNEPETADRTRGVDGRLDVPCQPIELLEAVLAALEARHAPRGALSRRQREVGVPMRSVSASTRGPLPLVATGAV
ncbi:MAG: hypothetical protein LC797_15645 [Chloroflexi bacterium]|nr:hypothetical protein [Chloroflexota bacterium]